MRSDSNSPFPRAMPKIVASKSGICAQRATVRPARSQNPLFVLALLKFTGNLTDRDGVELAGEPDTLKLSASMGDREK